MRLPSRNVLVFTLAAFLITATWSSAAIGQEGLPPETLARLKAASAFLKVKTGPLEINGSAFVFKIEGDVAYLVTNAHVVDKPKLDAADLPLGARLRDRLSLLALTGALANATTEVSAVFRSGTAEEQTLAAQVTASDDKKDLAIIRVAGLTLPLAAIAVEEAPRELLETQAVYVVGFPFGAALGVEDKNPAISIGKGSISSVRKNEKGDVVKVQIDGAVNPGNSGGAVVDASGKLVGVATATIRGAGIGLAVPPHEILAVLESRAGSFTAMWRKYNKEPAQILLSGTIVDPYQKVASVQVDYLFGPVTSEALQAAGGKLAGLPGAAKATFKQEPGKLESEIPSPPQGEVSLTVQMTLTLKDGQVRVGETQFIKSMPAVTIVRNGNSTSMNRIGAITKVPGDASSEAGGSAAKAPAGPSEIEAFFNGKWHPVKIVRANSERYLVKYPTLSNVEESVSRERLRFPVWESAEPDKRVEAMLNGWWSPAVVLERDGERLKVHYAGWSAKKDDWVSADQVRAPETRRVMRTWTDATGKHKVEAVFVKLADGKVTLKTSADKTVTMALDKLSDGDQEMANQLAKLAAENPFGE